MSMTDLLRQLILGSGRRKAAAPAADDERAGALKQNMPLVPANTIAGRALVTVIAIMTFLASLAAGAGILVSDASSGWTESIAREMTIQIKPASGHDVEADVAEAARIAGTTAGIAAVHVVSRAESERLLEPWLGTGLDLGELPVPRLIVLSLAPSARVDLGRLRTSLSASVPNALVDDHRLWLERLATMAHTLVVIVGVVFLLVLVAMALAIMFATHGAMAGNREIVDVLHFVGAADRFIAREFQRHFLRLGLRGGAIGGGFAILAFGISGYLSRWFMAGAGSDQVEALFGTFSLGLRGYIAIGGIALGVAVLTGIMSRSIVFRHLRSLG
jgi:cell division transport system permease protein